MKRLSNLARAVVAGLRSGELRVLADELRRRVWSNWTHYGLSRDLDVPFEAPNAKIPLKIRTLRSDDVPKLLGMDADYVSDRGPYVRMHRLNFVDEGLGTCYVAVTDGDEPCYMQWLMPARQNDRIEGYFRGIFPRLEPDQALLEYAFTREDYQGKGVMPAAMARIAEKARDEGGRSVITFVDHQNIPALKGCQRSGFSPYLLRLDRWRLFRRTVTFTALPPGAPYPYETPKPSSGS
jgi:GNAT superfamily N-acetyltransferase